MSRKGSTSCDRSMITCPAGMHKNQLQELAQRSCFNLPSYSCIREGPDHAPRFKATVSFNGEVFESPGYYTTLRQAEHAAAEVALNALSKRGPTQYLASRILDETGVCKNLLQETAQRAGVSLPVYTTIKSGPKHLPLFKCMVEVGGRRFMGDPAKTKKQAEKNAATAAWSALQRHSSGGSRLVDCSDVDDAAEKTNFQFSNTRPRLRTLNFRDKIRPGRDGYPSPGNFFAALPSSGVTLETLNHDSNPSLHPFNQAEERSTHHIGGNHFYSSHPTPGSLMTPFRQAESHQRRHSLSGMESPADTHEAMVSSMATSGGNASIRGTSRYHHSHQPHRIRGLPLQSLSDRFDLNRPSLLEELQQRDDDDWMHGESVQHQHHLRNRMQSLSERFEYRSYLPQWDEEYGRGNEEWLPSDPMAGNNFCRNAFLDSNEHIFDRNCGYNEGWLRGDMLLQKLEENKKYGYKEGWLQGDILKHNLPEENGQMWLHTEAQNYRIEEEKMRNHYGANGGGGHMNPSTDGWYKGEYLGGNTDKESMQGISYGMSYPQNDVEHNQEAVYRALAAQSTSAMVPTSSSFSSLLSKSTQWWGSQMPGSTSSTAAALASTVGLRQAANMAPAVRVRHMVPVCSAPPQRCNDTRAAIHATMSDISSPVMDSDLGVRQLLNKLRL